jgi:hypothetical protein
VLIKRKEIYSSLEIAGAKIEPPSASREGVVKFWSMPGPEKDDEHLAEHCCGVVRTHPFHCLSGGSVNGES